MIKDVEITNFKCFKERQVLQCGPVTLIYGPNSAGKSTVCQALRIVYEQFIQTDTSGKHWCAPTICRYAMTELAGGRFTQLVHGHIQGGQFSFRLRWAIAEEQKKYLPEGCEASSYCDISYNNGVLEEMRFGYGDSRERFRLGLSAGTGDKGWRGNITISWHESPAVQELLAIMGQQASTKLEIAPFIHGLNQKSAVGYIAVRNIAAGLTVLSEKRLKKRWPTVNIKPDAINGPGQYRFSIRSMINGELRAYRRAFRSILGGLVFIGPQRRSKPTSLSTSSLGNIAGKNQMDADIGDEKTIRSLLGTPVVLESVNDWLRKLDLKYEVAVEEDLTPNGRQFEIKLIDISHERRLSHSLANVGFGIGQLLPIVVQSITSQNQIIVVDEPEVHVHPRLQAAIGDLFIESAKRRGNQFIIETHSENLLRRLQRRIRHGIESGGGAVDVNCVAIGYVEPFDGVSEIRRIDLDSKGRLATDWPGGFFEEGYEEAFA